MNIVFTKVFPFIEWRRRAYGFSAAFFAALVIATIAQGGFNLGIDFVGGTSVLVKFDSAVTPQMLGEMRSWLEPSGLGGNIRTIGATTGATREAREVSIDVRGTDWVDAMTTSFRNDESFYAGLEPHIREQLEENFRGDTERPALYDPTTIRPSELHELFQKIFNENIAITIQNVLAKNLPPNEPPRQVDVNHMVTAERLAAAIAEFKRQQIEVIISALSGATDTAAAAARPWSTVDEFITAAGLVTFDNPSVRRMLHAGETAPHVGSVSVLTGSPAELSGVFSGAIAERFLRNAQIVIDRRDQELGGLFTSARQAADFVPESDAEMKELLVRHFHAGRFVIMQAETVGASIGAEMKWAALYAILISIAGILLYVWLRFEFRYGVGAVVALVHDTALTVLVVSALGREFNVTIVAAVLTVMGYSVNDTIVVFDRIREKLGKLKGPPDPAIIDLAITETLSRTILTGGSMILSILAFAILGPLVTRDMCLVLFVGVVIGTFSSIFVASPVLVEWDRFAKRWSERRLASDRAKKR